MRATTTIEAGWVLRGARSLVWRMALVTLFVASATCGGDGSAGDFVAGQHQAMLTVPVLSEGPFELVNTQRWLNSGALTIRELTEGGQVVLLDFWTYTCINCINTFPALKAWHSSYGDRGLTVLGVHTPEFEFERDFENVAKASGEQGLEYPIVQDNEYSTWRAFGNRYWPAIYIIDSAGRLRHTHFGEGGYAKTESILRSLLVEAGNDVSGVETTFEDVTAARS